MELLPYKSRAVSIMESNGAVTIQIQDGKYNGV